MIINKKKEGDEKKVFRMKGKVGRGRRLEREWEGVTLNKIKKRE